MNLFDDKPILIGGGGHAASINEVLKENQVAAGAYVDLQPIKDIGLPFILEAELLAACGKSDVLPRIILAIGSDKSNQRRAEVLKRFSDFPVYRSVASTSSIIAPDASFGKGTIIMPGACVRTRSELGMHCVINTMCSIDHDSKIGNNVHVGPGATLCGNVTINENVFIGAGAILLPGVVIPRNTTVPAGEVVKK